MGTFPVENHLTQAPHVCAEGVQNIRPFTN